MTIFVSPSKKGPFSHFIPMPVDCLPRDKDQSALLHQPRSRISNIDPMIGSDVSDVSSHPSLVDGNLTMYFQSEQTRKDFINMPLNHPSLKLHFEASSEDDRGG